MPKQPHASRSVALDKEPALADEYLKVWKRHRWARYPFKINLIRPEHIHNSVYKDSDNSHHLNKKADYNQS